MCKKEKKRQRIYDLLNAENKPKITEIIRVSLWPPSSPDLNPLDYAIWGVLENKTNVTSHRNIGSLKNAIEEEWNKMSEEFISKAYNSFRRRVHTMIAKMAVILSKFTVLYLYSYFAVDFLKLVLILILVLFYNRVVYYTRIFFILFPNPIYCPG